MQKKVQLMFLFMGFAFAHSALAQGTAFPESDTYTIRDASGAIVFQQTVLETGSEPDVFFTTTLPRGFQIPFGTSIAYLTEGNSSIISDWVRLTASFGTNSPGTILTFQFHSDDLLTPVASIPSNVPSSALFEENGQPIDVTSALFKGPPSDAPFHVIIASDVPPDLEPVPEVGTTLAVAMFAGGLAFSGIRKLRRK